MRHHRDSTAGFIEHVPVKTRQNQGTRETILILRQRTGFLGANLGARVVVIDDHQHVGEMCEMGWGWRAHVGNQHRSGKIPCGRLCCDEMSSGGGTLNYLLHRAGAVHVVSPHILWAHKLERS